MSPVRVPTEVAAATRNQVGEGPVWLADEERLLWVDITRHLVQWFDPRSGGVKVLDVGRDVGAVAPTTWSGLVAALPGEFALVSSDGAVRTVATVEADRPGNRMNDGKCDSQGRFWAGTMAYDLTPDAAALYRLNTDCSAEVVVEPVTLSNGIGWSPDDRLMYYIDSTTQRLDVFDFDAPSGKLRGRRTVAQIPEGNGMPDGLTVDADGCIWVALWGGGAVRRFTPDGRQDMVIELPVSQVTSCAFGGTDLSDLYITSAATGLSDEQLGREPQAGALFRCRPGQQGLPPNAFAGCTG